MPVLTRAYVVGGVSAGGASADSNSFTATAAEDLQAGKLVYITGAGTAMHARADVFASTVAIGMVEEAVTSGNTATIRTHGSVTLVNWSAVVGSGSLSVGSLYFLSPTLAGCMTTTTPLAGSGHYIAFVGIAQSAQTFHFERGQILRRHS